jgi:pyrrolidone-carboxylate peptidase
MKTDQLRARIRTLTANGRKLDTDDVRRLLGSAKDKGAVSTDEARFFADLPRDLFQPGARESLDKLLSGTRSEAYVNLDSAAGASAFGRKSATGTRGVALRFEDGMGRLTQNSFWLEGKAKASGKVEVNVDGKKVRVTARAGEPAGSIARRLASAMPPGYSANVNDAFPGNESAAIQVFKKDVMPPELVKPVLDGRAPPVKVLITGYGKFAHFTEDGQNPSWQMAQKLAQKAFPGAKVEAVLVPVEWSKVDAFARTVLDKHKPDVIINLGYGRHTIEYWAENKTSGDDAAAVMRNGEPAVAGGRELLSMTLPEEAIERALARTEDTSYGDTIHLRATKGKPRADRLEEARRAQLEDHNNKYLCNYMNYRMLDVTRGSGIMSGFFHVDETTAPQELEAIIEQSVIERLKQRQAQPAPSQPAVPIG